MSALEHKASVPPHFTMESIELAHKLSASLNNGVSLVTFSSPGKNDVSPTGKVAIHTSALLAIKPQYYNEHTSIEGTLQMVSLYPKPKIKIYSHRLPAGVMCTFPSNPNEKTKLINEAKNSIGERVEIYGRLRSDNSGRPLSMEAKAIRAFRPEHKLPKFKDLEGIDITGGLDPTEFIRRLRDDDE
jgi:hypothetical protein